MGFWVSEPTLEPAETSLWERPANRTQSRRRAVGGRLFLTTSRLLFEPNRVDAVTGGRRWSVPLAFIGAVGEEPRDGSPFSGGLRRRLRLELADGTVELFVVGQVGEVVSVISGALHQ